MQRALMGRVAGFGVESWARSTSLHDSLCSLLTVSPGRPLPPCIPPGVHGPWPRLQGGREQCVCWLGQGPGGGQEEGQEGLGEDGFSDLERA